MWDLPGPGIEPVSPALAGRFSTTAPPRKPQHHLLKRLPLPWAQRELWGVLVWPYNKCLVCCCPVGLMNASHSSPQNQVIWGGAVPQMAALKVGVLDVCSKPFVPLGEAGSWGSPSWLQGTMPRVGFMMRECLSLLNPFRYGYFLSCPMCRSHSTSFWISFRGNRSICSCIFGVSMGGRKVRNLLCHHLGDVTLVSLFYSQSHTHTVVVD